MTQWRSTFQTGRTACTNQWRCEQPCTCICQVSKQLSKTRGESKRDVLRDGIGTSGGVTSSRVLYAEKSLPVANHSEASTLLDLFLQQIKSLLASGPRQSFTPLLCSSTYVHVAVSFPPTINQISAQIPPSQKGHLLQLNRYLILLFFS